MIVSKTTTKQLRNLIDLEKHKKLLNQIFDC